MKETPNFVLLADGNPHRDELFKCFTSIPAHEVPRLREGEYIWVEVETRQCDQALERAHILRVVDTKSELAVVCDGKHSHSRYRKQVNSMHETTLYRLKDEYGLTKLLVGQTQDAEAELVAA